MARRKKETETSCGPVGPNSTVRLCMTKQEPLSSVVKNHDDACTFLRERGVGKADRESFYALHLDVGRRVVGYEEVAKGDVSSVSVNPREVFKGAILANASEVVVAHNHPSQTAEASSSDIDLTKRLVDAGRLIGIPILDHVIVTDKSCKSLHGLVAFGESAPTGRPRKRRSKLPG